jgi:hypothetical protein
MGFFSDLFGGESKTGMKESLRQNQMVREMATELGQDSRDAAYEYIPRGMEAQRQASNAMFDLAKQVPQKQLNMLDLGSQDSQAMMLGGLDNYTRAMYGLPTQQMQVTPMRTAQYANQMFQNVQRPNFMSQPVRNPMRENMQTNMMQDPARLLGGM